jgi:Spy/CpxP family protein refolding chaperone
VAVHAANPPSTPAPKPEEKLAARPGPGADRLGLTDEQKAKIASLREQMKAVLTPEQQQRMSALHDQFAGRPGPGGPGQFRRGGPQFGRGPGFDRHGPQRFAQHRPGPQPRFGHHRGEARQLRHHAARGQMMKKMQHQRERRAGMLGLTDEQRAKMRQIAFQNREKAIGLRADLRKEMESVLTPEQKAKVKEMKEHHGRRGPGRPPGL